MTTLLHAAPVGAQRPRVSLVPRAASNDVEDAVFLATSYGLVPDEWQEHVLEGWLGVRADGRWAAPRCGLACPRQNGKNGIIEARELFGMVSLGERFLHTAHEVKTARKAFLRLLSFFENERQYPELASLVKEIRKTNGQEAIVLTNGGSVEFVARSRGSGRGFSVDVLVLDEAQEYSDETQAALLPTISASDNPQTILTGTPPSPGSNGEVFTRTRDEGLAGGSRRLCWMEWSCDGDAVDLDDHANWAKSNPALGIRLQYETTTDERSAMDDETFARERLGMWGSTARSWSVIEEKKWLELADPASVVLDPVAFAVDVTPDGRRASISLSGRREDGLLHLETIQNEAGTGWVAPRLVELAAKWKPCAVVVDPGSTASVVLTDLQEAGIEPVLVGVRELGQACGEYRRAVEEKTARHTNQPQVNSAVAAGRKRSIGDGGAWAWARRDATSDITPLVSQTLALHGFLRHAGKRTGPKRAVGRVRSF